MLRDSVLAFESLTQNHSLVILLNEFDLNTDNPIIAICGFDKNMGINGILVNEITSIYDKERFKNFLMRSYNANKAFYKNKKTGRYFTPNRLQLPEDIKYALSDDYSKSSFTKSQVISDYKTVSLGIKPALSEQIHSALARAVDSPSHDKVPVKEFTTEH